MWIAYKTIVIRDVLRFSRIWVADHLPTDYYNNIVSIDLWRVNGGAYWTDAGR